MPGVQPMPATAVTCTPPADTALPLVLAGPILRRLMPDRLTIWLALSAPAKVRLSLDANDGVSRCHVLTPGQSGCRHLTAGRRLHYLLIDLTLETPLPTQGWVGYTLSLQDATRPDAPWLGWQEWAPDLCYPGRDSPGFVLMPQVQSLLHGSCRKPHHRAGDGLTRADELLARCVRDTVWEHNSADQALTAAGKTDKDAHADDPEDSLGARAELPAWPSALIMTGDQIYADDVAGPMLRAIHHLVGLLDLPPEQLAGIDDASLADPSVTDAAALYAHPACYYRREQLLPQHRRNRALIEILFGGVEKPVFTTASAHNHLITLGEVLAMYLLAWSPAPWACVALDTPVGLSDEEHALYAHELPQIQEFTRGLSAARRVLAHLPIAMIFDDHDITDDWNLSREWEDTAYGHGFSRRILGNALLAYLINQGWGNRPEAFDGIMGDVAAALRNPGTAPHDACLTKLRSFDEWQYTWNTTPPLVVIDTRTRRWRSERVARHPSGLMDWEALTDLQHILRGHDAVLLVSAAPIFGVKLIETIQRAFTWCGHPLMVDAENWMAHRDAAHTILNIFRHRRTPRNFVVLSGDVHYSFVYDVELRGRVRGPDIWQICSSGLRNEFPPRLLAWLDRGNRWLYSPRSPLNWFTRRRNMRVIPRKPEGSAAGRRLLNGSSIGLVEIDEAGAPWRIRELMNDGRTLSFEREEAHARWR